MTELIVILKKDAEKYLHVPNPSILKAYWKREMFRYIFWLRLVHYLKQKKWTKYILAPLPAIFLKHLSYKYGVFVDTNIEIGPGLKIIHGGCLYVNALSIGSEFTIYQGVTLGASPGKGIPVVGNGVVVYTGAVVVGDVILNDNCQIAANAVVTHYVPANEIMMGVPARQYKRNN